MRNIIQRFSSKIQNNSNSFIYLYGGGQVNFELTFEEQANQIDKENNKMKILVYENENDGFPCPYCGIKIKIGTEIDDIIKSNNNIKETINGIKFMLESIIKTSVNNSTNSQLKNINIILNTINEDIKKNNEKLEKLLNSDNNSNEMKNKNIIKGIIEISTSDINKNIVLFNTEINKDIDVYIDKEKINIIKENNTWQYNFNKPGKYMFEIVFNDDITNCKSFFKKCNNIISFDLSNFNTSNIIDMEDMFSECNKLKEIKGLNQFNANKVNYMNSMFQECNALESLNLSNFNTEIVMVCHIYLQDVIN
jgi:surface protein